MSHDSDRTATDAPALDTDAMLRRVARQFGGTAPNVYRTLASAPAALHLFVEAEWALETAGLLDPAEQACVALEVANDADCHYCRSSFIHEARRHGVSDEDIGAIIENGSPPDSRWRLISQATRRILATRGRLGEVEVGDFARRGLDEPKLIEIAAVIGAYTVAAFANNLSRTRIDPEFRVSDDMQPGGTKESDAG